MYREPLETRKLLDTIFAPEKVPKITRSDIRSLEPSQNAQQITNYNNKATQWFEWLCLYWKNTNYKISLNQTKKNERTEF